MDKLKFGFINDIKDLYDYILKFYDNVVFFGSVIRVCYS